MNVTKWDGSAIATPGVFSDVPMAVYHRQLTTEPSASRSGLWRLFDQSPAHYFEGSYLNPEAEPQAESEPLLFGRAAHHLILGETNFSQHFVVRPDKWDSWRTDAAKEWRAEQQLDGLAVLEPKHLDIVRGMARGLAANPVVRAGILSGLIETTLTCRDPETGVWLKIRPDAMPTDSGDFSDFKTTADISDDGIETAIGRDGLFMQGAMAKMVAEWLGMEFNSFTLVFAEKSAPYCVQTRTLVAQDIDLGYNAVRAALNLFARCLERGVWPGPGGDQTDAAYISMKPYHRSKIERQIEAIQAGF